MLGWALLIIGLGLCSLLDRSSSTAAWVTFQIICSAGLGLLTLTLLPAIQASLEEKHVATSTGMWSFARGFGAIWGVTVPNIIFNNEARGYSHLISDVRIARRFAEGQAYELATEKFLDSISNVAVREQVVEVFTHAIKKVWYIGIGVGGFGLLLVFVQKTVKLREEVNTEFGLEDRDAAQTGTDDTPLERLSLE